MNEEDTVVESLDLHCLFLSHQLLETVPAYHEVDAVLAHLHLPDEDLRQPPQFHASHRLDEADLVRRQLPQLRHLLGVGHEVEEILVRDELLDQVEDRLLDGRAGDVLELTLLGDVLVRVIAAVIVERPPPRHLLAAVGRNHRAPAVAALEQSLERSGRFASRRLMPFPTGLDLALNRQPQLKGNYRLVLSLEQLARLGVADATCWPRHVEERPHVHHVPPLVHMVVTVLLVQLPRGLKVRTGDREPLEGIQHLRGVLGIWNELRVDALVPVGNHPARPDALLAAGGHLVPNAVGRHLTLELRESHQQVHDHPPHRSRGVDLLGNGQHAGTVPREDPVQLREVPERTRNAVELVHDHHVDLPLVHVLQQLLKSGTVHVAARVAAIVVMLVHYRPALPRLAVDVGRAGVELGFKGIVVLVESFVGGLAGVDGASLRRSFFSCFAHFFIPKNAGPFQWVPVIALATAVRDLYFLPSYSTSESFTTNTS